jgi:hypothetical protein
LFELVRVFDTPGATIGRVEALQAEVATTSTRCLSVAFNLAALAFVACDGDVSIPLAPQWFGTALRLVVVILVVATITAARGLPLYAS